MRKPKKNSQNIFLLSRNRDKKKILKRACKKLCVKIEAKIDPILMNKSNTTIKTIIEAFLFYMIRPNNSIRVIFEKK